MDPETLRLIITASAAILGGLIGSGVTAFISRRNTVDTLAAARLSAEEAWIRAQEREHAVWLRDQKQEAYSQFITLAQSLHNRILNRELAEAVEVDTSELEVERGRIKIIGSPAVRSAARALDQAVVATKLANQNVSLEIELQLRRNENEQADNVDIPQLDDALGEAMDAFFEAKSIFASRMIEFVEEVRKDLGTVTTEDEALDAKNRDAISFTEQVEDREAGIRERKLGKSDLA